MYGDKIWEEIALGTNQKAAKLEPGSTFLPISIEDIKEVFGTLIIFSSFKSDNEEIRDFLRSRVRKIKCFDNHKILK